MEVCGSAPIAPVLVCDKRRCGCSAVQIERSVLGFTQREQALLALVCVVGAVISIVAALTLMGRCEVPAGVVAAAAV
jgi:hypothetical protein